jgi:hypothetical protein
VPQLWQKWQMINAQTGAFDRSRPQGMFSTGTSGSLPPSINFFSASVMWGSSAGELYACPHKTHFHQDGKIRIINTLTKKYGFKQKFTFAGSADPKINSTNTEETWRRDKDFTNFCHEANQRAPREPNEKKTEDQLNLWIRPGENASPVTDPKYIPLYTKANERLRSSTGTQRDSKLFIAGIATPSPTPIHARTNRRAGSPI